MSSELQAARNVYAANKRWQGPEAEVTIEAEHALRLLHAERAIEACRKIRPLTEAERERIMRIIGGTATRDQ